MNIEPIKLKLAYSELSWIIQQIRIFNFDITNWEGWQKIIIADILQQIVMKFTVLMFRNVKTNNKRIITLSPSQAQALLRVMVIQREFLQNWELSICSYLILEIDKK